MYSDLHLLALGRSSRQFVDNMPSRHARPRRGDWHRVDPMPTLPFRPFRSGRLAVIGAALLAALMLNVFWQDRAHSGGSSAPILTTNP